MGKEQLKKTNFGYRSRVKLYRKKEKYFKTRNAIIVPYIFLNA